jgi:undecaprenyl pyrophosphate synthase
LRKTKLDYEVNCTQCNVTFSVSHGGRSDINDHMKSGRHKNAVENLASRGSYFFNL